MGGLVICCLSSEWKTKAFGFWCSLDRKIKEFGFWCCGLWSYRLNNNNIFHPLSHLRPNHVNIFHFSFLIFYLFSIVFRSLTLLIHRKLPNHLSLTKLLGLFLIQEIKGSIYPFQFPILHCCTNHKFQPKQVWRLMECLKPKHHAKSKVSNHPQHQIWHTIKITFPHSSNLFSPLSKTKPHVDFDCVRYFQANERDGNI